MEQSAEFSPRDVRLGAPVETERPPITSEDMLNAINAIGEGLDLDSADLRIGLDIARNQLQRGNIDEALMTYAMLVCCRPTDAEFQIGLANCALHAGHGSLALQAAAAAAALLPGDPRGHLLAGRACLMLGRIEQCRNYLTEAAAVAAADQHPQEAADCQRLLSILHDRDELLAATA